MFCIARPALTSTDYGYQGRWWWTDQRSGHRTPGLTSRQWGQAHTDTRHRARMPGESSLTWAQASSSLLTASQHYSQFLCSHQHCARGCVMKTHLYVDSCLCLEKWQKTKYTKILYLHKIKLNFVKLVSITILTWYSISKLKRVYKNKICVHLKSILNKIPKVQNTMKYFCIWGQRWMKVLWEFQDYFIWSLLWKAHIW